MPNPSSPVANGIPYHSHREKISIPSKNGISLRPWKECLPWGGRRDNDIGGSSSSVSVSTHRVPWDPRKEAIVHRDHPTFSTPSRGTFLGVDLFAPKRVEHDVPSKGPGLRTRTQRGVPLVEMEGGGAVPRPPKPWHSSEMRSASIARLDREGSHGSMAAHEGRHGAGPEDRRQNLGWDRRAKKNRAGLRLDLGHGPRQDLRGIRSSVGNVLGCPLARLGRRASGGNRQ